MGVVGAIRSEARALLGEGRGRILVPVALGWGLLVGTRVVYPVLLPFFRDSFGLTLSTAGLLVTILWLGSAVGQLPSGILADRYSERPILAAGPLVVALGLTVVIFTDSTLVLFLATGLVGIGISLYPIARITILSDVFPDRIGSALGVTMATGDLGQTIVPPIAGVIALAVAWQLGLGLIVPLLVGIAVVIWLSVPVQQKTESAADEFSWENFGYLLGVLRQPSMVLMTLILFLYIFIWQSFSAFYPTYLIEMKGLSSAVAGGLFGLFFAFGVVVKPLAGSAYDRVGMRTSLIVALVCPVGGLVLLPFIEGFWMLVLVTALVSTMLGTGAITQSFLSDSFPDDIRGTGLGVVRTTSATLGALGPVVFGVIADWGYFDEGYLVLAAIMVAVILLTSGMGGGR